MSDSARKREDTLLEEANELLRSAYSIAERKGAETNWEPYKLRLLSALISQSYHMNQTVDISAATCTAKTFRLSEASVSAEREQRIAELEAEKEDYRKALGEIGSYNLPWRHEHSHRNMVAMHGIARAVIKKYLDKYRQDRAALAATEGEKRETE